MSGSVGPPAALWWCITTCMLYGVGSGSMAFFNKGHTHNQTMTSETEPKRESTQIHSQPTHGHLYVFFFFRAALVSSLGFRYSNSLLFFQMIFCVTLFQMLRWLRWIEFRHPLPSPTPSLSSNIIPIPHLSPHLQQWFTFFMKLAPISIFYMLNAGCGMLSLQGLSLPMFSVLKRFTPIIVAVIEYVLWKRTTTRMVTMSLLLCASGFILAGLGDLVFDFGAYTLAIASCVSQALYLINVDKVGKELSLTSHELLYYNSLISLFLLAPFVWLTGELHASLFIYDGWSNPTFLIGLIVMLALGTSLNYFQFLCTQVNSPLTTCMVGVMKGILTTIGGFFMFGGQPLTLLNLLGVFLNTTGGALYAWAKYAEKQQQLAHRQVSARQMSEIKGAHAHGHTHAGRDGETQKLIDEFEADHERDIEGEGKNTTNTAP